MGLHKYDRVIMDVYQGANRTLNVANNPEAQNFRVVSHFGEHDWSPYMRLSEAIDYWVGLPKREDGFFLLVEG